MVAVVLAVAIVMVVAMAVIPLAVVAAAHAVVAVDAAVPRLKKHATKEETQNTGRGRCEHRLWGRWSASTMLPP